MGLYIEPGIDKKQWCDENGELVTETRGYSNIHYSGVSNLKSVVCLVDNGYFFAGAVAFNQREFDAFNEPDGRSKRWYLIPTDRVKEICPMWNQYMERT